MLLTISPVRPGILDSPCTLTLGIVGLPVCPWFWDVCDKDDVEEVEVKAAVEANLVAAFAVMSVSKIKSDGIKPQLEANIHLYTF